jgi:hypothetical protein
VVRRFFRALKRAPTVRRRHDPRLKPGATVLTQASPAVVGAVSNYTTKSERLAGTFRTDECVAASPVGVAGVRTVAPGFNRGYSHAQRHCEPVLTGARTLRHNACPVGVAGVRTVAPGFNRGYSHARRHCEPVLTGERAVLA